MNAPNQLIPELLLGARPTDQPRLDLASQGVQRYVAKRLRGDADRGTRRKRFRQRRLGGLMAELRAAEE